MPAAKTKSNEAAAKGKASKHPPPTDGSSNSVPVSASRDTSAVTPSLTSGSGKPDKSVYDAEQEKIKTEIDALQVNLNAIKDKISLASKSGPGNDRRSALLAELDSIREQQSGNKASRGKTLDKLKALQEGIQKKTKDLQAARSKMSFKTVGEVDAHIKNLEKQVESGNMKLVDEKRALQEISLCKRNRRTVESFQTEQQAIDADRAVADELRNQLDDPTSKAVSERYDAIKAQLDELSKEREEAYASRSKLYEERDDLQEQLNSLFNQKRQSAQNFRDTTDRYWNKVNEDRARRAEKFRAQRAAEEIEKKQELVAKLREEAAVPAFQAQVEDCQTLIEYFSGKSGGNVVNSSAPLSAKTDVIGLPKLELRTIEAGPADGLVARKKKGEDEVLYFAGKGKGKGKKGAVKVSDASEVPAATGATLNVPLPTLSALLALSIPPPVSTADVPRVITDLKTKKAWYEANQGRVTAENISKAEAGIKRLTNQSELKTEAPLPDTLLPNSDGGPTELTPQMLEVFPESQN